MTLFKHSIKLLSLMLTLLLTLSLCSCNKPTDTAKSAPTANVSEISGDYPTDDLENYLNQDEAVNVTFDGSDITASDIGVDINENTLCITSSGTYSLKGNSDDAQVIVDADNCSVNLVLSGLDLRCSNSAPLYIKSADKVTILVADGTENTLSDTVDFLYEDIAKEEPNATLYSKDDLIIQGNGTLNINANFNNALTSKDDLKITGSAINITAVNHGINGKDLLAIKGGTFTINSGGDALRSSNDTDDDEKGNIVIDGGNFNIESGEDGIQAEKALSINAGTFNIKTGKGSSSSTYRNNGIDFGRWEQSTQDTDTISKKAVKAQTSLAINGGTFIIDAEDDAIHTNADVKIAAGEFDIAAGDDAIHADNTAEICNGRITVSSCYEGIEASEITLAGGNIDIKASDDGLNASNGASYGFMSQGDCSIYINGGALKVNAQGDGIDSNGKISMTDGTVCVFGTNSGGNGILDYDSSYNIEGGALIGSGTADMLQLPVSQNLCSFAYTFSSSQSSDTLVYLTDSKGNTVFAIKPEQDFQTVIFSSNKLKTGEEYTIYTGGTLSGDMRDGYAFDISASSGNAVDTFTLSSTCEYLGSSSGMGGFMGGQGGMGGGPDRGFGRRP